MRVHAFKIMLLLMVLLLLASVAASPYWAVHQIQQAAKAHDAEALAVYVDFPQVKSQLKAELHQSLIATLNHKGQLDGMEALGSAMVDAFVSPMVEAIISPASLSLMMQGQSLSLPMQPAPPAEVRTGAFDSSDHPPAVDIAMGYASVNQFEIALTAQQDPSKKLRFTLSRLGAWRWQITAIHLPMPTPPANLR